MFVYVIVCTESLKLYIGQHKGTDLGKYLSKKFYDANRHSGKRSHLYAAMRKYPRDTWGIHALVSDLKTKEECDELERHYIKVLKTQHPDVGYNICDGGEGFTGAHTPETLAKIDEKRAAYWEKPEGHERISRQMTERWEIPEFRNKVTALSRGRKYPGRVRSEASKRKASASMKGKQNTLGHVHSEEHKAKQSASLKNFYQQNPKTQTSEEGKAILREAHKHCKCPRHVRKREQDLLNTK